MNAIYLSDDFTLEQTLLVAMISAEIDGILDAYFTVALNQPQHILPQRLSIKG